MTISERIFIKLEELHMTEKEFSQKTGISQSAISEWKSKQTNPTADKIMVICNVLNVSPEWLLSGYEQQGNRGNKPSFIVVDKSSDLGKIATLYNKLSRDNRARLMGYMQAFAELSNHKFESYENGEEDSGV